MDQKPILTEDAINQNLRHMEFPWPSLVVSRGNEIERQIAVGGKFPFKQVIHAHAGDPQGMGQKPMTFFRQITAVCINPNLLQSDFYPSDVKLRAMTILTNCTSCNTGSTDSFTGLTVVRQQVAKFIQLRDGVPVSHEDIFLSTGATDGLRTVLYLFNNSTNNKPPGVMVPIPQYPLFSSTVAEYGMYQISYYLNESTQWSVDIDELRRAINESKEHCEPRVLVIINPGNPSGYVMSQNDIQNIIKFAYEENLFLLADEVYQQNVYDPSLQFHSFKKVMTEMGPPYNGMELASFMSASKGYMGECGSRIGYCEIVNLDSEVKKKLIKLLSLRMTPTILGQIGKILGMCSLVGVVQLLPKKVKVIMYCITNPPLPSQPSYELFEYEKNGIIQSLKERAEYCFQKLNSVEGLSCNKVDGAMYVYPRVHLSEKALREARERNLSPDEFYALEMLENVGICVVPGCLFGQKPNTYHFRLTFLPQMDKLKIIIERILQFHQEFYEKYKD